MERTILVAGGGVSGEGAAIMLLETGASVILYDGNEALEEEALRAKFPGHELEIVLGELPDEVKKRYLDMVVRLNGDAPEKGIEMSIVRKDVCRPFVYPTPFELHFSVSHLEFRTAF